MGLADLVLNYWRAVGLSCLRGRNRRGDTHALDQHLISLLRTSSNGGEAIGPPWFNDSMRDVTALGGFTFLSLLTIVVVLSLLFHKKRRDGIIIAATAISTQTSIEILKILYDRPRPNPYLRQVHAYTTSFPSGHTAESTAIFPLLRQ